MRTQVCLGVVGCDPARLSLLPCGSAAAPSTCQAFKLVGKQLVHNASGLCATSLVQSFTGSKSRRRQQVGAQSKEQEMVARLQQCAAGNTDQEWQSRGGGELVVSGRCLSTAAR